MMARPKKTTPISSAAMPKKAPVRQKRVTAPKAAPADPATIDPPVYTVTGNDGEPSENEALAALTVEPVADQADVEAVTPPPVEAEQQTIRAADPAKAAPAEGIQKMADVMETTKKYAEEAKAKFQAAFSDLSEKAKAGVEKSTKAIEELSDLTKGNVEAMVESGKIAAKGVEALGQDAAEYGRVSFEKASATIKSFAAIKTPAEFFQLHSELLTSSFDTFAKESAKNSEALLKLASDVVQPISGRVSIVTEKVKSLAA